MCRRGQIYRAQYASTEAQVFRRGGGGRGRWVGTLAVALAGDTVTFWVRFPSPQVVLPLTHS